MQTSLTSISSHLSLLPLEFLKAWNNYYRLLCITYYQTRFLVWLINLKEVYSYHALVIIFRWQLSGSCESWNDKCPISSDCKITNVNLSFCFIFYVVSGFVCMYKYFVWYIKGGKDILPMTSLSWGMSLALQYPSLYSESMHNRIVTASRIVLNPMKITLSWEIIHSS